MNYENLAKELEIRPSVGLMLVVWDVLSNKLGASPFLDTLSVEEQRAVRCLDDLCEHALAGNGIAPRPAKEWDALMSAARLHVNSLPIEFEDSWPQL